MSIWDKYFAPGDLRRHQQIQSPPAPQEEEGPKTTPPPRIDAAHRVRRQNALLYGGLAFTALSLLVTRRTLLKKRFQISPNPFTPSNEPPKVDGSLEAVEALGVATLNVFSLTMASAGVAMTYFDIADIEDMRDQVRKGVGYDVYGGDSAGDKEIEGWVAEVLARKDGEGGLKEGIAEKLMELEKKDRESKVWEERRR